MDYAGRDATSVFLPIHPSDTLDKNLLPESHLGCLDESSARELAATTKDKSRTRDELRVEEAVKNKPPLSRVINLRDMEGIALKSLSHKAMAYYLSSADDTISYQENPRAFSRFFFHPRVMKAVSNPDPSTTMLGYKISIPVFICAAALARMGHPLGEVNLTRGAYQTGIPQMVSSHASLSYKQIAAGRGSPEQPLFFQLYKHRNNEIAAKRIKEVESLGYKAIFLTVDALVPSNRELDIRVPHYLKDLETQNSGQYKQADVEEEEISTVGTAGGLVVNYDLDMTWDKTIPWIRSVTQLPIVVKGIQCVADAVLAAEAGCEGILLSNHGGRQLDYSLPPIELLYRIRKERPDVFQRTEVYIDGGVYRGTDVLKALCLGARAVGLGRSFLYAQSAYGQAGVVHLVRILEREIKFGMASLGVRTVEELTPELVERVDFQPLIAKL